jgi:alpha-glucosidase (family GH31 glycosyl hydrolase)
LFYDYPTLDNAFTDIESTFMVGGALKVSPVLKSMKGTDKSYSVFFPQGNWVSMKNLSDVIVVSD